ncbi:MAG: 50S ribosomal protein L21 [Syntrophobacteraceae bacterium]
MYAIFKACGKQYKAQPGQIIRLEKISGEVGENVTLGEVLLFSEADQVRIGRPVVEGVAVSATIVEQGRGPKIVIFKHKRRKDYRKKQGHRQDFTAVRVENIG